MAYRQLVQPNLDIYETAGWCLQFTRRVFGAPAVEPTAWQGWERTQFKHHDRNWPNGVSIPVWFDWWGDVGHGRQRYGHVAVLHTDGRVYSSPLTGYGRAWFVSVDDLVRAFGGGMTYVGWTEDISGVRVVKKEEGMTRQEAEGYRYIMRVLNSEAKGWDRARTHNGEFDEREIRYLMGLKGGIGAYSQQAWDEGANYRKQKDKWRSDAARVPALEAEIRELKAKLADMTPDGFEEVKEKLYRKK